MKRLLLSFYIVMGAVSLATVISVLSHFLALDPADIFKGNDKEIAPISVQLPDPPKKEEPPEPPPSKTEASLLSTLAPDSFAGPQDIGGGVSFGSGGFGPAVGGGGGFGTDASQLVKERESINRPPKLVMKGELEYPAEARQRNISGYVLLKILVNASGGVDSLEVEDSQPRGYFDQAAIRSVKNWKFEPALIKGQIVAAWTSQKIKFELN